MHTALSYTATLDPSSAATCAPPPAHARAHSLAHRMRQARVPKEWSCAGALRCKWITRLTDSTNLGHAEVQHANCARAHTGSERAKAVSRRGIEVFRWVLAGATHLLLRSGQVPASSVTRRRWPRPPQPASATMAHPRHGRADRPSGPVRIFRAGPDAVLRRHGRREARLASRHAQRAVALQLTGGKEQKGFCSTD